MLETQRGPQFKPDSKAAYFTVPVLYTLAAQYAALTEFNIQPLLSGEVSFDLWDPQYLDSSGKQHGMHTMDALRCLVDAHRTRTLLAGIEETVTAQKQLGKEKVVAIDAGTGTGILSMGLIEAGCDEVYALEINEQTAATTQQFVAQLGLADRIHVVHCDATQVTNLPQANILVSENLSNGLMDEPQYPIIHHSSQFLSPDASIVPFKAQCFASLGKASWDGIDEPYISMRKLTGLVRSQGLSQYFEVDSSVGMNLTHIQGETVVDTGDVDGSLNTLIISTRFQINKDGVPYFLDPDTAEFLGKSYTFRVPEGIDRQTGLIRVKLSYPPGIPVKYLRTTVEDNQLLLQPI